MNEYTLHRYMRSLLMFDLPVETANQRREYRRFIKFLKREGFIMFQESIYVKLSINESGVKLMKERLKAHVPAKGLVSMITITEKQFQNIDFLQGEFVTDIIQSEDKVIEL